MASKSISKELTELTSNFRACYQCSTCSGGCPVFRIDPNTNPRLLIEDLFLGKIEELFDTFNIWNCCSCLTCSQRCPQGVDYAHLLFELKNLAAQKGNIPQGIRDEIKMLYLNGKTANPSNIILKRREKMDLPEIPAPNLEDIHRIMKETKFLDPSTTEDK